MAPRGLLKVSATLGFGRRFIAPALSKFARAFPEVEVQLHLTDRPVNLVEQGFDVSVRIGTLPDARLTARKLASNTRVLCASPGYLSKAGEPTHPRELQQHRCLFIREGDEAFGSWHLRSGGRQETVKVRGALSSNDGECALAWALDGHGILLRSRWDAAPYLRSGRCARCCARGSRRRRHLRGVSHQGPHVGQDARTGRLSARALQELSRRNGQGRQRGRGIRLVARRRVIGGGVSTGP